MEEYSPVLEYMGTAKTSQGGAQASTLLWGITAAQTYIWLHARSDAVQPGGF